MYWANKGKKLAALQSELDKHWERRGYLDTDERLRAHVRAIIVDLEGATKRARMKGGSRSFANRVISRLREIA